MSSKVSLQNNVVCILLTRNISVSRVLVINYVTNAWTCDNTRYTSIDQPTNQTMTYLFN